MSASPAKCESSSMETVAEGEAGATGEGGAASRGEASEEATWSVARNGFEGRLALLNLTQSSVEGGESGRNNGVTLYFIPQLRQESMPVRSHVRTLLHAHKESEQTNPACLDVDINFQEEAPSHVLISWPCLSEQQFRLVSLRDTISFRWK